MQGSPTADEIRARQRREWGGVASGWGERFDWYEANFRPIFDWCCEATGLAPGHHVLDVACGCGEPAMAAAMRVAPGGKVVATDLAPEMLETARACARARGIEGITFVEMDAEDLRFESRTFDAVTCAFGVMFPPQPERAVREMRRVLKPKGRFAIVVWDELSRNPYFGVVGRIINETFDLSPPPPDSPWAFRFAAPGALESLLRQAECDNFDITTMPMSIRVTLEDYLAITISMRTGLSARLASLSRERREAFDDAVHSALAPFHRDGELLFQGSALCAVGWA